MNKKLSLLLVAVLALSLLFCFGAVSGATLPPAADDPVDPVVCECACFEEGVSVCECTEDNCTCDDADCIYYVAEEEEDTEDTDDDFVIPVPEKVGVTNQPLKVDGVVVEAEAYNIDGYNYFKLRDLAALLTGTGSKFNVTYEEPNMIVTTGEVYDQIAGDLEKGEDKSASCVPSRQTLLVNGDQATILIYNIGGNNYFQLRGLGTLVGFEVDYDDATRTMLVVTADDGSDDADDDADDDTDTDDDDDDDDDASGIVL